RLGVTGSQGLGKPLPADFLTRLPAQGIYAGFRGKLAPFVGKIPKNPFVGFVTDEALLVLNLDIVAVDRNGGQGSRAMGRQIEVASGAVNLAHVRRRACSCSHCAPDFFRRLRFVSSS